MIKAFITKYALTKGIYEIDANVCVDINDKMISQIGVTYQTCFHKPEWHLTKEEAIAQAEKMRENKIKSLNKQIQKLQKLKF